MTHASPPPSYRCEYEVNPNAPCFNFVQFSEKGLDMGSVHIDMNSINGPINIEDHCDDDRSFNLDGRFQETIITVTCKGSGKTYKVYIR